MVNNLENQYNLLVAALEKKNVPCRVKLNNWNGRQEIDVECGRDYPDSLFDKITDAYEKIEGLSSQNVSVCADSSGATVIKSTRIAGGPKRY